MNTIYVGLDVHKETICLHGLHAKTGEIVIEKTIPNDHTKILKELKAARRGRAELKVCYEAGCTGFSLYRFLADEGIHCEIIAPSKIPSIPGSRIKTDKRDAAKLAQLYAGGYLTRIHVPNEGIEAARSLTRLREDCRIAEHAAKQRILGFCLSRNKAFKDGKHWTGKHLKYLHHLKFSDPIEQYTFQEYLNEVLRQTIRLQEYDSKIKEVAQTKDFSKQVENLRTMKGFEYYSALAFVAEIGDFQRFETATQFASYLGLVPGQRSSGPKINMTGITKTGNGFLRKLLTQASHNYRYASAPSARLEAKRAGKEPLVLAYASKAQKRCEKKFSKMRLQGKAHNIIVTAVSRELACFVWGMMTNNIAV